MNKENITIHRNEGDRAIDIRTYELSREQNLGHEPDSDTGTRPEKSKLREFLLSSLSGHFDVIINIVKDKKSEDYIGRAYIKD